MTEQDQIAAADDLRTKRNFISLLSGYLGTNDASNAYTDGYAVNPGTGYQIIGINGAVGVEGVARSNLQNRQTAISGNMLLLMAVAAYFLFKK